MSEAKSSKASKPKTPKTESAPKKKSESAGAKTKAKDDTAGAAATSAEAKAPDTGKDSGGDGGKESGAAGGSEGGSESGTEGGKSARESIGGKADVHYGYFSSVRSPAYRSGWDAIWGNGKNGDEAADGAEAPRPRAAGRRSKPRKRRDPITVTLDLDALPPELKEGLVEIARAELKKSRVSYARRDKAGAIDWRITCRVD